MCAQASKVVIVIGPQIRPYRGIEATVKLAEVAKYATAVLPNAKVGCHNLEASILDAFPTYHATLSSNAIPDTLLENRVCDNGN